MRRTTTALAMLLLVGFTAAQDKDKAKDEPSREDKYKAIAKESADAAKGHLKDYNAAKDKAEKSAALQKYQAAPKAFAAKMLDLAKAKPDDATGFSAALFVVNSRADKESKEAVAIIRKHHLDNPKLAGSLPALTVALGDAAPAFLQEVFDKSSDKTTKGLVLRTMANTATRAMTGYKVSEAEIPAKKAVAIKLWEQVEKDFGDVMPSSIAKTTLGAMAKDELDMLKNYFPGSKAAEIAGEDIDGKPIKLSDYRGKVVMLDFWGTWCPPCMAMVPHNLEIANKFKDKPFVLLGVNSDKDKEKLATKIEANKITFRSFWNGDKGTGGPISNEWKVHAWPTVVLVDHKGVIRRRIIGGSSAPDALKAFDDHIETLIKEVKAD